jgi:hypothetical protein
MPEKPAKQKAEAKPPKKKPEKAAAPKKTENYTIQKWHKMDMFQCVRCPWSTLNEDEMVRHVAKHFSSIAPSVRRTDTGFVTVTGDKIIREEIVEPFEEDKEV